MFRKPSLLFLLLACLSMQPLFAQTSPSGKEQPKARAEKKRTKFKPSKPKEMGSGATKLTKMTFLPELDVYLPKNFTVLSDDGIAQKYPTWKKPKAVYSDPQGNVDFIVTERRSDFRAADTELLQKFYKASIMNMFNEVQFLSEKQQRINGRDYVAMEFLSSVKFEDSDMKIIKPVRKYTYIMYTVDEATDKMVVLTLQAPLELRDTWQDIAPNIMESVHLKHLTPGNVERAPGKRKPVKVKEQTQQPQQTRQPSKNTLNK